MCGSETLTTVVSRTSMKVLDITAMAISQGLISGRGWVAVFIGRWASCLSISSPLWLPAKRHTVFTEETPVANPSTLDSSFISRASLGCTTDLQVPVFSCDQMAREHNLSGSWRVALPVVSLTALCV